LFTLLLGLGKIYISYISHLMFFRWSSSFLVQSCRAPRDTSNATENLPRFCRQRTNSYSRKIR